MIVVVTDWLCRRTPLRHLGTALLVIVAAALVTNLGITPTRSVVYDGVFSYVAPFAIFLPLLQINLKGMLRAGLPMLAGFALAAAGTFVAVPLALYLADARSVLGDVHSVLGGLFVGTYTGGSVNFNALALHYGVAREGTLFAGTVAVDNIVTAVWMGVTLVIPRMLGGFGSPRPDYQGRAASEEPTDLDLATVRPFDLALVTGLGALAVWFSSQASLLLAGMGLSVPSVLILTTIALVLAQFPSVAGLAALQPVGMFAVYLFLAVVGAFCDLSAWEEMGDIGGTIFAVAVLTVLFHGLVVFGLGRLFCKDWAVLAVASQAGIGGATSALALARSLQRRDLLLPGVLVGSLGYGVGTYLGFITVEYVLG